jgi:hypothetical protein
LAIGNGLAHCPGLTALNISREIAGGAGERRDGGWEKRFAADRDCGWMTCLEIADNWLGDEGGVAIGNGLAHCPGLASLNISGETGKDEWR